jgi:polar amino acid transport system substrate-binding protein
MRRVMFFMLMVLVSFGRGIAQNLTIYCEDDPPNQMLAPDGKLTGMSVEITQEIQKRIGNQDPIEMVPWARGYDAALKNPNTVLMSMSRTAERNPLFHWVGPVLESNYTFYAKAGSKIVIKSLDDAKKLERVGVYNNDVRESYLSQAGFNNLERTTNNIQNFKKLMSDRLDVYASSPNQIEDEAKAAGFKASDAKPVYTFMKVQLYIAMSKGTPDAVVKSWCKAFASMQKDGSFAAIHKKYYPTDPLPGKAINRF